jgi:SAM-dependent methyltransferase
LRPEHALGYNERSADRERTISTKSYSSGSRGPLDFARQARHLVRGRTEDVRRQVSEVVERVHQVERASRDKLGIELTGLQMLDVGAGQLLLQMSYFSLRNEVVGIDRDLIVHGFDPLGYLRMARVNGPARAAKTVGRKALLIDARYRKELARQVGVPKLPPVRVGQMDAAETTFEDERFDFVYSFAVFQHLARPDRVVDEMIRVLRPGGGMYFDFILYTGRTGSHDVRLLSGGDPLPLWAHLRPGLDRLVRPSAYVNRFRLPEWRRMLGDRMEGCEIELLQPERDRLEPQALALRESGVLKEYDLDELVTSKVRVLWRKPSRPHELGQRDQLEAGVP